MLLPFLVLVFFYAIPPFCCLPVAYLPVGGRPCLLPRGERAARAAVIAAAFSARAAAYRRSLFYTPRWRCSRGVNCAAAPFAHVLRWSTFTYLQRSCLLACGGRDHALVVR